MSFPRLAVLLLAFISGPLQVLAQQKAFSPLTSFTATYAVSTGGLPLGTMHRELKLAADGNYVFSSNFRTTGLAGALKRLSIEESSTGNLTRGHFVPREYRYLKINGHKRKEARVNFDWQAAVANGENDGQPWQLALAGGELDPLVYQLALAIDLANRSPELVYTAPESGKRQRYPLKLLGTEIIETEGRKSKALRVEYLRKDTRRTTLWCDPARGYLPVQIEYREKDGSVSLARLSTALMQKSD